MAHHRLTAAQLTAVKAKLVGACTRAELEGILDALNRTPQGGATEASATVADLIPADSQP